LRELDYAIGLDDNVDRSLDMGWAASVNAVFN